MCVGYVLESLGPEEDGCLGLDWFEICGGEVRDSMECIVPDLHGDCRDCRYKCGHFSKYPQFKRWLSRRDASVARGYNGGASIAGCREDDPYGTRETLTVP
jgi:hypothetical protein